LSEEAKQRAIEWMRKSNDELGHYFTDEALETLKDGCEAFNFKLANYSIDWSCPGRSSYRTTTRMDDEIVDGMSGARLYKYLVNNFSEIFWERKVIGNQYAHNGEKVSFRHSKIQKTDTCGPFTGVCYDEAFLDPFRKFLAKPDGSTFDGLIKEAIESVLSSVEKEIDYRNADEALIEDIEANEYEFTENGKII